MKYLTAFILMCFMSVSYAYTFDDHIDDINDCLNLDNVYFSGAPEVICDEPEDYNPCQSEFSGEDCTSPEGDIGAVFVPDSGNYYIMNTYIDKKSTIRYVRMKYYGNGIFKLEDMK